MTVDFEKSFERARDNAAAGNLVVIRKDGERLLLPAVRADSVRPEMVSAIERMLPSAIKRNVAVIGDTSWASDVRPSLQAASQAIPFWGLLMGFASVGHSVWVFQGAADQLEAGCRGADVLIVDSASLGGLSSNWKAEAVGSMRNPQVLVHDRASYRLLPAP